MKHSLLLATVIALCSTHVNADELPPVLSSIAWARSQESFSEVSSFIALHRWLLEQGFSPCKPVHFKEIIEPEPPPNMETFWYVGSYNGSPLVHIRLELGTEPNHLGLDVQIGAASKDELEDLKKKFQPLIDESKKRVRQIVYSHKRAE